MWVKDEEAEKAAQLCQVGEIENHLLQRAKEKIAPLQDSVDLGIVKR